MRRQYSRSGAAHARRVLDQTPHIWREPADTDGLWSGRELQPQDKAAIAGRETERTEAAAQLERKMAAMEAALAARRQPIGEAKPPEAARGPGADLRFQARRVLGEGEGLGEGLVSVARRAAHHSFRRACMRACVFTDTPRP